MKRLQWQERAFRARVDGILTCFCLRDLVDVGVLILNLMLVPQMRTGTAAVENKRCKASTQTAAPVIGNGEQELIPVFGKPGIKVTEVCKSGI